VQSPQLVRAMLWTRLGRRAPSSHRRRRVESIAAALEEVTSHLPAAEGPQARGCDRLPGQPGGLDHRQEECGLSAEDARLGIAWAIGTLVAALRQETASATT